MEAGAELRCGTWVAVSAISATWTASLPAMVARGDLAGPGIATTAGRQNTAMAMTATAGLVTVLRAGIRRQAAIPTDTADSQPNGAGGHSPMRWAACQRRGQLRGPQLDLLPDRGAGLCRALA